MQIYIKRSKNRTAFYASSVTRAGNQGTDVYDSRLKQNPIAETGHCRDQGHLLSFLRTVVVDDGERVVSVQDVVLVLQSINL